MFIKSEENELDLVIHRMIFSVFQSDLNEKEVFYTNY